MKYLLDTCVISELVRPVPCQSVLDWIKTEEKNSFFLSVLTLGELTKGISRLTEGRRGQQLQQWLDYDLTQRFESHILDIDREIGLSWGKLTTACEQQGRPLSVVDGLLAATATVYNLTVVTRNTKHFQASGVSLFNPWDEKNESPVKFNQAMN